MPDRAGGAVTWPDQGIPWHHVPELKHDVTVVSMNGEFCTTLTVADVLTLLDGDAESLERNVTNE